MNKGRLFWGSFLVGLGALVLLDRSGALVIAWGGIWPFWPVLLILIGVSVIGGTGVLGRSASVLTGILAAALVVSFLNVGAGSRRLDHPEAALVTEAMNPGTEAATFSLSAGVGTFVIAGGGEGLMQARIDADPWTYDVDRDSTGDRDMVWLQMDNRDGMTWMWNVRNTVEVDLNPAPVWEINLETGAARLDADLRNLAVETIRVSAGASTIRVRLGGRAEECTMRLEAGASSVRVEVPEWVGCDVRVEAALSAKRFPGFEARGDGWYETENFETAAKRIHLDISAGVSSIRVIRVPGDAGVDL